MELDPSCEIKEECGIFGIFAKEGTEAAPSIYYGLCALQHRGQESCGIAAVSYTHLDVYKRQPKRVRPSFPAMISNIFFAWFRFISSWGRNS